MTHYFRIFFVLFSLSLSLLFTSNLQAARQLVDLFDGVPLPDEFGMRKAAPGPSKASARRGFSIRKPVEETKGVGDAGSRTPPTGALSPGAMSTGSGSGSPSRKAQLYHLEDAELDGHREMPAYKSVKGALGGTEYLVTSEHVFAPAPALSRLDRSGTPILPSHLKKYNAQGHGTGSLYVKKGGRWYAALSKNKLRTMSREAAPGSGGTRPYDLIIAQQRILAAK